MPTNEITQPTSNDSKEKIGAMGRAKIRRFALEAALRKKNGEEYLLNDEYLDYSPDDYPDCIAVTPGDTNNVDPELLNYFSKDGFLYYIDKTRKFHKLCTNIHVTALFRNADDEKWGMLITFVNQDKKEKEVIVYNSELIMPDANNVYKRLSDAGWNCFPRQFSLVIDYISRCMPKRRILLIEKSGWSSYNGEMIYTLPPDEIIGSKSITDVETRYVGNNKISFHKAGKLANWKKVVTLCEGNPILMTALGQAFV